MKDVSLSRKGLVSIKAFLFAFILFAVLIAGIGLLMRFTPMPERWALYYAMGALCIVCLMLGVLAGNLMKRRGILYGVLFSVIFTLFVLVISVIITGTQTTGGIFQLRYLLCYLFGGAGGMIGVNLRN